MPVKNQIWLNTLMLVLSISLIQWHSIQFWMESTGAIGPLWSITIEAAALWLWWQRRIFLACCASLILIIGPLSYLALPVYESHQSVIQQQSQLLEQKASTQDSITQLTTALESYQQTSQTRIGWAARIDETQSALKVERDRFDKLVIETPQQSRNTFPYLTITIETLAVSILMLTQILSIHALRNVSISKQALETIQPSNPKGIDEEGPVTYEPRGSFRLYGFNGTGKSKQASETDESNFDSVANEISKKLMLALKSEGITQSEWARRNNISKKSVSMLINHSSRRREGKECISKNELMRIKSTINSKAVQNGRD